MNEIALELTKIYIESKKNTTSSKEEILDSYFYFKDNLLPRVTVHPYEVKGSTLVDLSKIKSIKK